MASSIPVICGIITSAISRSGGVPRAANSRTSSGFSKLLAANPELLRIAISVSAITFSSSTT